MKDILTAGLQANVQYVVDADNLQRIIKSVVSEAIAEMKEKESYLSADQVCQLLQVSKPTLWRWQKSGYLEPVRFGGKVRYKESDIKRIGGD